ncbi:MAG TPA: hypothetical protein VMV57_09225 [Terracidiphilus sp.]|nr:hypothetical protein [Terracidiphilus sp.]
MLRISQLDWRRILYTRTAAILLGIAAVLTIPALIFIHSNFDPGAYSGFEGYSLEVIAGLSPFGLISLLACMAFFWLRCDLSSKRNRTVWFVILLLGFGYGSQIAYYLFAYLPAVLKRLRNHEFETAETPIPQPAELHQRIGPFRTSLLFGWGVIAASMLAILAAPASFSRFSGPVAIVFFLCSAIVAIEGVIHWFVSIYRSGMARPPAHLDRSSRPHKDRQD